MSTLPSSDRTVVVVGAAAAGLAVVETLRREGFDGKLILVGEEEHAPYDRPPLSKQILSSAWEVDRLPLRAQSEIDALALDLRLGVRATSLHVEDQHISLSDGSRVEYDTLVVCTGVRARRLPGDDGELDGVHVIRSIEDALSLKSRLSTGSRLVVVGAGFLGSEVAAVARELGAEVTMVEPTPVPLAQAVGEDVGRSLSRTHIAHGVDLRTGVTVSSLMRDGDRVTGVRLEDGTELVADNVLVGIGSIPNTEWLEGSGLTIADGLVCDEYCLAGPNVYSAGDVARWHNPLFGVSMRIEHRTNASEQGMAVARNILAENPVPFAPVPYFWSDQYNIKIQAHGYLRGHDDCVVVEGSFEEGCFLVAYRKGDRLVGALSVGMMPKAIRPWRAAIANQMTSTDALKSLRTPDSLPHAAASS
ncbi:NAD(P)/FAD-dependent oxidoreductase [Rhodococcus wratislaviensis]|uniref:NAD(P)/FAD-dependent oxidoreductase n=1 Tax=Rhodococcus wratislaviensis TaxID=44752 RepID=UPI003646A680